MAFRFIHMADVHLDTPFSGRDKSIRKMLRELQRQSFKSVVDMAVQQGVDAVLIAGDLFDNDTLSFATEKFLLGEMERLNDAGIDVFYAPGNHDPWGSIYRLGEINWPLNVHVFKGSRPEVCTLYDDHGRARAVIAGAGHECKREGRNIASTFPKASGEVPYIGLFHGFVTGKYETAGYDRYAPCSMEDLTDKGYVYWALGHIHVRAELKSDEPVIIYPGNVMGRNFSEEGLKGVYCVEIDDNRKVKAVFCPIPSVCYRTVEVEGIEGAGDFTGLERLLVKKVEELSNIENRQSKLFLRLVLKGPSPLYEELQSDENMEYLTDAVKESLGLEYLEISVGAVERVIDIEEYKNKPHILGTVLSIIDRLKYDDELLLKLAPHDIAGASGMDDGEKIKYLRGLLEGLDREGAARLIKGDLK